MSEVRLEVLEELLTTIGQAQGNDGFHPGGRLASDAESLRAGVHRLGIDGALESELTQLLDDGPAGELALRSEVHRVGFRVDQLGELGAEIGDVAGVALGRHNVASQFLEARHRGAARAFGVVRGFRDGRQVVVPVNVDGVAGVDAQLVIVDGGAEDVVAGRLDVGAGRRGGEQYDALRLRRGEPRPASRRYRSFPG